MKKRSITIVGIALCFATACEAIMYDVTAIPMQNAGVSSINDHGVCSITSIFGELQFQVRTWSLVEGFVARSLPPALQGYHIVQNAISNNGDISVFHMTQFPGSLPRGISVIRSDNSVQSYWYPSGWDQGNVISLNSSGRLIAFFNEDDGTLSGNLLYDPDGQPVFLPGATGQGRINPFALNDANQVIAYDLDAGPVRIEANGQVISLPRIGGDSVTPRFLSHRGEVAGYTDTGYVYVWNADGSLRKRLFVGGTISGIQLSDSGHVAFSALSSFGVRTPYLWSEADGLRNLRDLVTTPLPNFSLQLGYRMNRRGEISFAGTPQGMPPGSARVDYYLTPVPEPGTLVAMGVGLVAILRRRRSGSG